MVALVIIVVLMDFAEDRVTVTMVVQVVTVSRLLVSPYSIVIGSPAAPGMVSASTYSFCAVSSAGPEWKIFPCWFPAEIVTPGAASGVKMY